MSRALALALALALLPACKAGRGDACRCATDCRDGLVCVAEGRSALKLGDCDGPSSGDGCCYPAAVVGLCVESSEVPDLGGGELSEPMRFDDLPSKRDLGGGFTSDTDPSTTDPSTTDPSTTDPSTTDPSTTDPSTTDASTTDASTTDASTTDASTTDASTTDASTT